jgi:hypothetical protein
LPAWVDAGEPSRPEMIRHVLERGARTFGVCRPTQITDYYHPIKSTAARPFVQDILAEGILVPVTVDVGNGKARDMVVHHDNAPLLQQAADGTLAAPRTTFLSPFDSLFWPMNRDVEVWGFDQALEAYVPAHKRRWGYFCLPILHCNRLVGRFDPKLERSTATMRLRALYLEPGVAPSDELVAAVAVAMRDFLAFHDAQNLVIERSNPLEFAEKLLAAL